MSISLEAIYKTEPAEQSESMWSQKILRMTSVKERPVVICKPLLKIRFLKEKLQEHLHLWKVILSIKLLDVISGKFTKVHPDYKPVQRKDTKQDKKKMKSSRAFFE
jgi:hypothetical protein